MRYLTALLPIVVLLSACSSKPKPSNDVTETTPPTAKGDFYSNLPTLVRCNWGILPTIQQ